MRFDPLPDTGSDALVLLGRHWRVLVLSGVLQLVAGALTVWMSSAHASSLGAFWWGAVLSGPVGFGAGLAWHAGTPERRRTTHWKMMGLLGMCALGVVAMALLGDAPGAPWDTP